MYQLVDLLQARSQPASQVGGGGLNLDGWNTRRTPPPLDIVRVTSSIWKTPPLLDIHRHPPPPWTLSAWRHPPSEKLENTPLLDIHKHPPPLGHCPCDVIHIFQGWNKIAKGETKSLGWARAPPGYGPVLYSSFIKPVKIMNLVTQHIG